MVKDLFWVLGPGFAFALSSGLVEDNLAVDLSDDLLFAVVDGFSTLAIVFFAGLSTICFFDVLSADLADELFEDFGEDLEGCVVVVDGFSTLTTGSCATLAAACFFDVLAADLADGLFDGLFEDFGED